MNALEQARTAYGPSPAATRTPRSTEYEAFARVTARLSAALTKGRDGFAALAAALHDNRRLWSLLAVEVADPANALPSQLRGQLFYLAEFTLQHSAKVLEGAAGAEVLVEINTAVMRGLRTGETVA